MNPRYQLPFLVVLAALLFLVNLGGYDLWPPDEPRFAQVAREMLLSGDYLVPRINGQPYTEKPPLLFWLTVLFSSPFGDVTEFSARLPLALGGMATVLLTFLLARRMFDDRVAFWSAIVLMTNERVWWQSRFGQIDMLLTAFVTGSIYCLWRWIECREHRWLFGLYVSMAAALLTKGPPGAVFPLLLALTWFRGRSAERRALHLFAGSLLALLVACVWMIPARLAISVESGVTAADGITANLFRQTIGRFFLGISHAQWPWFYLTHIPFDFAPWSLFLPWIVYWVWKHRSESGPMRFLVCWIVPAFVFFSLCIGKRSVYLLPIYPPLAILTARSLIDLMESHRVRGRRIAAGLWGSALVLAASAAILLPLTRYPETWRITLIPLSACIGLCGMHALHVAFRTGGKTLMRDISVHFCTLALLIAVILFPAVNPSKSAREFCAPMRLLSDLSEYYDLYSVGFSREEFIFYAKHFHEPILCDRLDIDSMRDLSPLEQATTQNAVKRSIQKAVRRISIADFRAVTDQEITAIRNAMNGAISSNAVQREHAEGYQRAVNLQLQRLFARTTKEDPAFVMVLEEDWRWILALAPDARNLRLLKRSNVGSRDVLLMVNDMAANLLARQPDEVLHAAHR